MSRLALEANSSTYPSTKRRFQEAMRLSTASAVRAFKFVLMPPTRRGLGSRPYYKVWTMQIGQRKIFMARFLTRSNPPTSLPRDSLQNTTKSPSCQVPSKIAISDISSRSTHLHTVMLVVTAGVRLGGRHKGIRWRCCGTERNGGLLLECTCFEAPKCWPMIVDGQLFA